MRKIKEVLRLHFEKELGNRQIGRSLSIFPNSVSRYLRRTRAAGIGWPLPDDLSEQALETLLFPPPSKAKSNTRPMPDWVSIHTERKRRSVTLALLWEEYKSREPGWVFSIASSASATVRSASSRRPCGKSTWQARSCLWTMPDRPFRNQRLYSIATSPGLSAKKSFYGIYYDNAGQVEILDFDKGNQDNTIEVLKRIKKNYHPKI